MLFFWHPLIKVGYTSWVNEDEIRGITYCTIMQVAVFDNVMLFSTMKDGHHQVVNQFDFSKCEITETGPTTCTITQEGRRDVEIREEKDNNSVYKEWKKTIRECKANITTSLFGDDFKNGYSMKSQLRSQELWKKQTQIVLSKVIGRVFDEDATVVGAFCDEFRFDDQEKDGDRKEVILLMFRHRLIVTTRAYKHLAEYDLKDCTVEEIKSKYFQLSENKVLKHRFKFNQNEFLDLARWATIMDPSCRDHECTLKDSRANSGQRR